MEKEKDQKKATEPTKPIKPIKDNTLTDLLEAHELRLKNRDEVEKIVDLSKELSKINKDMYSGSYANYTLAQEHAEKLKSQFASESNLVSAIENKKNISKNLQAIDEVISDLHLQLLETTNNTTLSLEEQQKTLSDIGDALEKQLNNRNKMDELHYEAIEKENNIRSAIEERNVELKEIQDLIQTNFA